MIRQFGVAGACCAVLALLPLVAPTGYWLHVLAIGFYYAILAASWSLLVGYVGRISFAQAAMSGVGAYTAALIAVYSGLPPWIGVPAGAGLAGLFGLGVGWLSLRLHGPYLGLTTIAFAEIARIAVTAEHQWTRGSLGLETPGFYEGAGRLAGYYIMLASLAASVLLMALLVASRVGLFFQAIREDEDGAASLGVRVTLWKTLAFAISTAFAGFAGGLYAHYIGLIAPSMMSLTEMGTILAMAVLGGFHNIVFAAGGGVLLQILLELLREIDQWRLAIFGLLTMLALRFFPDGLFGGLALAAAWLRRGRR